jgi:ribosome biogenesis ATPase
VQARAEILSTHARRLQLAPDVNLEKVAQDPRCEGFSGADLAALLREAGTAALRRLLAQTQEDISEV